MDRKTIEVSNRFVRIGHWLNGVLYSPPQEEDCKKTVVLAMHSDSDYLCFPGGEALARNGYRTLCANVERPEETLEKKLLDVKACAEYLRSLPGVEKLVILGHSGGATLMSCYQAAAENGANYFRDEHRIVPLGEVGELPAADGILLIDSNWGNGAMTLLSIDPAVIEEGCGIKLDPAFDLADPKNGFDPEGSRYPETFVKRYQKAQAARNERLIDAALMRLEAINAGRGAYADDEPWIVTGGSQFAPNNRLFPQDVRYLCHTKGEWPLLHADGSVTVEQIRSLRRPRGVMPATANNAIGTLQTTVKEYLSGRAVRTTAEFGYDESGVYGVDWDSSFCVTPGNVKGIHVPALVMGMTAGYEFLAAELIYHNLASEDKSLAFVEGASHMLFPAKECERFPGQFGDTVKTLFDHVADWLDERF